MKKYLYSFFICVLLLISGFILIDSERVDEPAFQEQPVSSGEKIPKPSLSLTYNDESIDFRRGSFCWRNTCEDNREPFRSVKTNRLPAGAVLDIEFDGVQPSSLKIYQGDSANFENISSIGDTFIVPNEKGTFYYQISGDWENGDIAYYTIVEVY